MKIRRTIKILSLIAASAALRCADVAAQEVVTSPENTDAASVDDPTAGYRFVKIGDNGELYIDYRAMGDEARDDERFAALAERFIAADDTLGVEDVQVLYYGRAFRDDYTGGYITFIPVYEAMRAGLYDRAYTICLELQRSDPASPRLLRLMYEAASKKNLPAFDRELSALERRYGFVLNLISYSGNGTMLAPYVVTSIEDEYELMYGKLGITEVKMQQSVEMDGGMRCDIMTVAEGEGSDSENDEVWFDISMPSSAKNKWGEENR